MQKILHLIFTGLHRATTSGFRAPGGERDGVPGRRPLCTPRPGGQKLYVSRDILPL